jgi:hypothetical protein
MKDDLIPSNISSRETALIISHSNRSLGLPGCFLNDPSPDCIQTVCTRRLGTLTRVASAGRACTKHAEASTNLKGLARVRGYSMPRLRRARA